MTGHDHHISFDPERDRSLRAQGARYVRVSLIAGLACLVLAGLVAFLGGGSTQADAVFNSQTSPSALVGVVELLAEAEHRPVESFEGQPVSEIATLAGKTFGDELPAHWDEFLHSSTGSGWDRFQASYLVAFTFVVSLSLGGLFFVLIQHVTRAGWSVVVRRIAEVMSAALAPVALLSLPILIPLLLGSHALFEWNDPRLLQTDELIRHKRPYLNSGFFTIRSLIYFGIWAGLGSFLLSRSRSQDETGDVRHTHSMQRIAPVGLLLYALTVNFFAFDYLMTLAPHWFSAIYGVYYFSGAVVGGLAVMILVSLWLQGRGVLGDEVTTEHYHDLGKLLFGFNFFWGYIAFSQYLLIWYANIPEETGWFLRRQQNGWEVLSLILLFGHLLIPFLGLMSRQSRRNPASLVFWSCWLLVMHWVDLYWNVLPQFSVNPWPGLVDVLATVGLCGVYLAMVLRTASQGAWLPIRDPRLNESLAFHNV
ncbi:MAG: quinol:cytochrome C oxidoreductase [Maioricimonas sp. JB049]